ncbi:hypothetical protein ACFL5Q_04550 [Planctomycetota bacterium]
MMKVRRCEKTDEPAAEYGLAKRLAESLERLIKHVEDDSRKDFVGNPREDHAYRDLVVVRAWLRRHRRASVPKSAKALALDSEYGVCPYCLSLDDWLYVEGDVWQVCHVDRTRWPLPANAFSRGGYGTEDEWRANETLVRDYRWVTGRDRRGRSETAEDNLHPCSPEESFGAEIEHAIAPTLPGKPGVRHRCLFEFTRALQAIPGFREKPVDEMKPYVREWHRRALPMIVHATEFTDEWEDFTESWSKVRFPKGKGIMADVLERARAAADARAAAEYDSEKAGVLVAICHELHQEAGDGPFYLSSHLAGSLIDISPVRAWRWLRLLCRERWIEVVETGNQGKATRYRYLGRKS